MCGRSLWFCVDGLGGYVWLYLVVMCGLIQWSRVVVFGGYL